MSKPEVAMQRRKKSPQAGFFLNGENDRSGSLAQAGSFRRIKNRAERTYVPVTQGPDARGSVAEPVRLQ